MGLTINAQDRFGKVESRGAQAVGSQVVVNEKTSKRKTCAAMAADAIRAELKTAFPEVKFRVTSKTFSTGDDVNVKWVDGPFAKKVDEILKKYQYGHFDCMTDMYEYSNRIKGLPQTKYLFTNREYSFEKATELAEKYTAFYGRKIIVEWKESSGYRWFECSWSDDVPWDWHQNRSAKCMLSRFEEDNQ